MTTAASLQGFRLSAQQRRTWTSAPEASVEGTLVLDGELDAGRLRRAFNLLVERHEILRTSFHRRPGRRYPLQVVTGEPGFPLDEAWRLTSLGGGRHELTITLPALCADPRTLANLAGELAELYGGAAPEALDEPVQYADFAEWQTGLLEPGDEETEQGKAYWEGQADRPVPPPLDLPFAFDLAFADREAETPEIAVVPVVLPAALLAAMSAWPAERLLAAWSALLARVGGCDRVALSVAFSGRVYQEIESSCGPFAKRLPVFAETGHDLPFGALEGALAAAMRPAAELQQYFDWERHAPAGLPEIGFSLTDLPAGRTRAGVTFTLERLRSADPGLVLALSAVRGGGKLSAEIQFDERRFARAETLRLAERLAALCASLEAVPGTRDARLNALDLLGPEEREEILFAHQGGRRAASETESVPRRFASWAARQPDAPALVGEDRTLTYGELNAAANRLAHHLRALGIGQGMPVAVCLEPSADAVVVLLSVMKTGGAFAFLEPGQPRERLASMLADLAAPVLVTRSSVAAALPSTSGVTVLLDADAEAIGRRSADDPGVVPFPEDLAYFVFTSGSTGRPKGVAVEHRQLAHYLDAVSERLAVDPGASFATVSTFAADLGHTSIFPALSRGGCLHVIPRGQVADAAAMAAYGREHRVDGLKIVPGHLAALLSGEGAADLLPRRILVTGGEALRWALVERVHALAPGLDLLNHYGPTETTVGVLTWRPLAEPRDARARTVPLGRPLSGVRCYVLDENLNPVPYWMPGELAIAGQSVTRGYLGRPDLTAERFLPDPFGERFGEPGARIYRTGDLARRLGAGEIEFLGRIDHQIKIHGFRVELEEIRGALARHPEVADCVVVARRDADDQTVLLAFYVAPRELEIPVLRAFLAQSILEETLPNHFVHLPGLPRTANGKVDLGALPDLEEIRKRARRGFTPPRTPAEELIASVWKELLGLERVSVYEGFFELGGHSLLATQLISRLRALFGVELPIRALFEEPVLARLAQRVERLVSGRGEPVPAIEPAPRGGRLPLSFAQERMWFLYQLEPGSSAYNSARAFEVFGRIDRGALEEALALVVRRHEPLRTTFRGDDDGQARQVIVAEVRIAVPVADLGALPPEAKSRAASRLVATETGRPFDLIQGPLMRTLLIRRGAADHLLLFAMHHIAADAWSRGIFVRELMACYSARVEGISPELQPLALQYADFAVWQRRFMEGERLASEMAYWRKKLLGAPAHVELPADFPRPAAQTFRGRHATFELAPEQAGRIAELGRRVGATPFMTLFSVFSLLLQRIGGQDDLSVGTDIANRNRMEVEGLIGLFVNNVVLRANLAGNPTFRELSERIREVTLEAYAHQDLPFDRLVTALKPRRDPSRTPLFQVLFVAQNTPVPPLELPGARLVPHEIEADRCKFDLAVFVTETAGRMSMVWNYSTDLFADETIRRWAGQFERLLASAHERPEAPIGELEMLTANERERLAMERMEREEASALGLRGARRRSSGSAGAVGTESLVRTELPEGRTLPAIVRPAHRDLDLVGWASAHRDFIDRELGKHGALLFRDWNVRSIAEFERFAAGLCADLYGEYGDLPREEEGGKVYHSTPYPPDQTILFHNESSHMQRWPTRQFFYCVQPAQSGGETPIVDCRAMVRELPDELVREFDRRKVAYVRNFTEGLDVSWRDFFRTEERSVAEERCRELGMEFRWKGESLETRQVCRAVACHPKSGEPIWFNQVQLHHPACLDPATRSSMASVFGDGNLPRNVTFGDGGPIADAQMEEITAAYWRLAVALPWQQGDVIMLDNMLVAHARNPFVGPRKIVVAMGDILKGEALGA